MLQDLPGALCGVFPDDRVLRLVIDFTEFYILARGSTFTDQTVAEMKRYVLLDRLISPSNIYY